MYFVKEISNKVNPISKNIHKYNLIGLSTLITLYLLLSIIDLAIAQQQCTSTPILVSYCDYDFSSDSVTSEPNVATGPLNGSTSVNGITGEVTYNPAQNFTGEDSFTYSVSDNEGLTSNIATVTITVHQNTTSLNPTDDVYVMSSDPSGNRGGKNNLRARLTGSAVMNTYLKFNVSGVVGNVESARIRMYVTDGSNFGGSIHTVSNYYSGSSNQWDENGLVFNNAPINFGNALSSLGVVSDNQTVEFDVTNAITGNGVYSFAIKSTSDDAVIFSSKEGTVAPVLTIQLGSSGPTIPTISGFSPVSGAIGTEVTITGTNFTNATNVSFNGTNATGFTVDSDNQIRAIVPSGATTGKISVSNVIGTNTSANDFTVILPPIISSFSPTDGPVGTEVTISGNNLATVTQVTFNGLAAMSVVVDNDTQIRANVPTGATTGKIQVTNTAGSTISLNDFTVTALPGIASFTPTSGAVGSEVTVTGVNFTGTTSVSFSATPASNFTVDSNTQLRATVPIGAATGLISITNPDGTGASVNDFIVVFPPSIATFTPISGSTGTEVTITGTNFSAITDVTFNNVPATNFTIDSDTQIRALVPAAASSGKIGVSNIAGLALSTDDFVVTYPPLIASFSPPGGPVGTEVTITGANFSTITNVSFSGVIAPGYFIDSDAQIRAFVPAGASTGPISVTNLDGTSTSNVSFTVTIPSTSYTFNSQEDAYIRSSRPDNNYGNANTLRARKTNSAVLHSYLKFNVSGLTGTVISAKIRLYSIDASNDGGSIYTVSNNYNGTATPWVESGLTFNNAPTISGTPLSSAGTVGENVFVEFDVTSAIAGNGIFSFGINSTSSDVVRYQSSESTNQPELIIETALIPSNTPNITSFAPANGTIGTDVTISGSNFNGTTIVAFNGTASANFSVDSNNQLRAIVPVGATTGKISVTNFDGTGTSDSDFTVVSPPVIASFTPANGPVGTEVTITGSNFTGSTDVSFNGTSASSFIVDSDVQILATVPAGASTGLINVTNTVGTAASATAFTVTHVPGITSFSPSNGPVGTEVTVTGVNFTGVTNVYFNGTSASVYTVVSVSEIRATVPPAATTGKISVTNGDGTGLSVTDFTVLFPPAITSFTPASGAIGTEVTVSGNNFLGTSAVSFNGTQASTFTVDSEVQIRAEVPSGAQTGPITVSNSVGAAASANDFTVLQLPGITTFTPLSGPVGTEVTITGFNFTGATNVSFNGTSASFFTVDSDNSLRATVPVGATTGKLGVTNSDGTGTSVSDFVVQLPPVISFFTPTSGPIGTEVTVSGSNFTGVSAVYFNGTLASTFNIDSDSQLRAIVPAAATTGTISVTNAVGTGISLSDFTVTAPPSTVSFTVLEDAYVRSARLTSNFGSASNLRVRLTTSYHDTYLKFNVTGLGTTIMSAKVRLYVTDDSNDGGSIYAVSNSYKGTSTPWNEHGLNWENAPQISGSPLSSAGIVNIGETIEWDVTSAISGNGTYSFALRTNSSNLAKYSSKEGGNSPELVIDAISTPSSGPTISSFTPARGVVATEVTILGSSFSGTNAVTFNGIHSTIFTVDSNTQIRANVPNGATSGPIAVTNADGTGASANSFNVLTVPTITSFSPAGGPINTEVTISGSGFAGLTDVSFNGISASTFTIDSETQVRANVPQGTTTGPISVTNPLGSATSSNNFVITNIPAITSFTPTSGNIGSEVTLSGNFFTGSMDVSFNGTSASVFSVDSNTLIRATVPNGAITGPVSVTNANGTGTSNTPFTILLPPSISSFTPTSGPIGIEVTITGNNFAGIANVSFNGVGASNFTVDSVTQIRVHVPTGASTGLISVSNAAGTATSATNFTVLNPPAIISFTPSSGPIGTVVTITGMNFTGLTDVSFNGTSTSTFTTDSNTQIRAEVPSGATTGPLNVTNADGMATSADKFTVFLPPTISTFNPVTGPVGTEVTITGSSFIGSTDVSFNGVLTSSFAVDSDVQIRATVPAGVSTGPIGVTNTVGAAASASDFTVLQLPGITTFTPLSGPVGTEVTLTGFNFTGATDVSFNGTSASFFTVDSDNLLRATVSSGATTGKVSVTNGDGSGNSTADFVVQLPPLISSFTPSSGPVGIEVTLSGSNFTGVSAVSFNGTLASVFSVDSDSQLRATVGAGASTGPISVTNVAGTATSSSNFTVSAPPSTLTFNPTDDAFVRSSRPTNNYEHSTELRVRLSSTTDYDSYLKFNVSGIVGQVQSARLRLQVIDASSQGGTIYSVSNNFQGTMTSWNEAELNFNNAPQITGTPLSSLATVGLGQTVEFDVTAAISSDGIYSFVITNETTDTAKYSSKDGVAIPELVITLGSGLSNLPTITSFSPSAGPIGTEVTVNGNNFTGTTSVSFNGVPVASFTVDSNTQLRANVPPGATTGLISVTNADGTANSTNDFSIYTPPTISSFSPNNGPVGIEVTISGSNFTGLSSVSFNGISSVIFTLDSDSQIRANVPAAASTGPLSITNAIGTAVSSTDFTVTQVPGITSFTPANGPVGTEVTVTGVNFTGTTNVSFNGVTAVSFTVSSSTQLRATIPSGASTGKIGITNGAGSTTSADDFTVILAPTISSFTPTSGTAGTEVTITGNNFLGTTDVSFNGLSSSNFAIDSAVQIRANAPSNVTTGPIRVVNAAGTATSAGDFTVTAGLQTLTFLSSDDAYVRSSRPTINYGHDTELKVRLSSAYRIAYLKFNVTGLSGPVQSAVLRLQVIDASNDGGSIYSVSNSYKGTGIPWDEMGITWDTAPEITGTELSSLSTINLNDIVEFDVTAAVVGDGSYSFAIRNSISDLANYSSKEGNFHPALVIETGSVLPKQGPDLVDGSENAELELDEPVLPEQITLLPNYPNPFNTETTIEYALPYEAKVNLSIFNLKGQIVRVLVKAQQKAGFKKLRWDGKNSDGIEVGTGVYFVRLNVDDQKLSKKITLQK